jgi:hypothetical protein
LGPRAWKNGATVEGPVACSLTHRARTRNRRHENGWLSTRSNHDDASNCNDFDRRILGAIVDYAAQDKGATDMNDEDRKKLGAMFEASNQQFQASVNALFPTRKPAAEAAPANAHSSAGWGAATTLNRALPKARRD